MKEKKEKEIGYTEAVCCANCKHSTPQLAFWDSGRDVIDCTFFNEHVWIAAICDSYEP